MQISGGKKTIVFISVLILGMVAAWYFVFSNIRERNENASLLAQQSAFEEKKGVLTSSIKAIINDTGSDVGKLNSYFVDKDGVVAFIESVETLGKENALDITINSVDIEELNDTSSSGQKQKASSTTTASSQGPTVELLKLTISVEGNWQNVFHFLSVLESMPFKLNVTRADLSVTSGEADTTEKEKLKTVWAGDFAIQVLKIK